MAYQQSSQTIVAQWALSEKCWSRQKEPGLKPSHVDLGGGVFNTTMDQQPMMHKKIIESYLSGSAACLSEIATPYMNWYADLDMNDFKKPDLNYIQSIGRDVASSTKEFLFPDDKFQVVMYVTEAESIPCPNGQTMYKFGIHPVVRGVPIVFWQALYMDEMFTVTLESNPLMQNRLPPLKEVRHMIDLAVHNTAEDCHLRMPLCFKASDCKTCKQNKNKKKNNNSSNNNNNSIQYNYCSEDKCINGKIYDNRVYRGMLVLDQDGNILDNETRLLTNDMKYELNMASIRTSEEEHHDSWHLPEHAPAPRRLKDPETDTWKSMDEDNMQFYRNHLDSTLIRKLGHFKNNQIDPNNPRSKRFIEFIRTGTSNPFAEIKISKILQIVKKNGDLIFYFTTSGKGCHYCYNKMEVNGSRNHGSSRNYLELRKEGLFIRCWSSTPNFGNDQGRETDSVCRKFSLSINIPEDIHLEWIPVSDNGIFSENVGPSSSNMETRKQLKSGQKSSVINNNNNNNNNDTTISTCHSNKKVNDNYNPSVSKFDMLNNKGLVLSDMTELKIKFNNLTSNVQTEHILPSLYDLNLIPMSEEWMVVQNKYTKSDKICDDSKPKSLTSTSSSSSSSSLLPQSSSSPSSPPSSGYLTTSSNDNNLPIWKYNLDPPSEIDEYKSSICVHPQQSKPMLNDIVKNFRAWRIRTASNYEEKALLKQEYEEYSRMFLERNQLITQKDHKENENHDEFSKRIKITNQTTMQDCLYVQKHGNKGRNGDSYGNINTQMSGNSTENEHLIRRPSGMNNNVMQYQSHEFSIFADTVQDVIQKHLWNKKIAASSKKRKGASNDQGSSFPPVIMRLLAEQSDKQNANA